MSTVIKRTTLLVRDMNLSRRWYAQVIELKVYYDPEHLNRSEEGLS